MTTISKEHLQSLPRKHIENHITAIVEQQVWKILETANRTTKFFFPYREMTDVVTGYTPSLEDLMEAFQRKFPDCKVYYYNSPDSTKIITVDWS